MKRAGLASFIGMLGASLGLALAIFIAGAAGDFGLQTDATMKTQTMTLFGVKEALPASSGASISNAAANTNPLALVTLANGLSARVVAFSSATGSDPDQISLWPDDTNPTWLIACNEVGTPGLTRIRIADGFTETIVTGTSSCDPARRTPWGTILFGEEAGGGANGGRVYELIDPLNTTNVTLNRATGVFSGGTGAANLTARPALGRLSFEGLAVYANGVVYFGDENRPGNGTGGGAWFKFIPSTLRAANAPAITSLSQSPLAAGSVFGLRLGRRSGNTDYGQGSQTGQGVWVATPGGPDQDLRAVANALKLTTYYRPEDADIDLGALAAGNVKFCSTNTGNEVDDHMWGEVICITDGTLAQAATNTGIPEVQLFKVGNPEFQMPDNVAYQPGRGNWVFHEDADTDASHKNNDLWDCLPDGADDDLLSDGCIRVATINDLTAEWTGGIFTADGKHFFVSVQHNISGKGLIIDITGWDGTVLNKSIVPTSIQVAPTQEIVPVQPIGKNTLPSASQQVEATPVTSGSSASTTKN